MTAIRNYASKSFAEFSSTSIGSSFRTCGGLLQCEMTPFIFISK